jgi:tetratricopeptide (TPR) repeat protein
VALLRDKDLEGAKVWLNKLERVSPEDPATTELKARVLHASHEDAKAIALLEKYSQAKDARIDFVARLLEEIGKDAKEEIDRKRADETAEKTYWRLAADTTTPENALALAEYLGRRGRTDDALAVWEQARDKCRLERASLSAVAILYAGKAKGEPCQRVTRWIESEIQKNPQSNVLNMLLERQGAIYNLEGRYRDAELVYRKIVEHDPRNAVCINNLAWLIVWNHREAEALELINRAITLIGREPTLLDTRGVVYLALGQTNLALNDLQEAVTEKPTPAVIFHLARAYLALQNRDQARAELRRAEKAGLQAASLHSLEQETYQKVITVLSAN